MLHVSPGATPSNVLQQIRAAVVTSEPVVDLADDSAADSASAANSEAGAQPVASSLAPSPAEVRADSSIEVHADSPIEAQVLVAVTPSAELRAPQTRAQLAGQVAPLAPTAEPKAASPSPSLPSVPTAGAEAHADHEATTTGEAEGAAGPLSAYGALPSACKAQSRADISPSASALPVPGPPAPCTSAPPSKEAVAPHPVSRPMAANTRVEARLRTGLVVPTIAPLAAVAQATLACAEALPVASVQECATAAIPTLFQPAHAAMPSEPGPPSVSTACPSSSQALESLVAAPISRAVVPIGRQAATLMTSRATRAACEKPKGPVARMPRGRASAGGMSRVKSRAPPAAAKHRAIPLAKGKGAANHSLLSAFGLETTLSQDAVAAARQTEQATHATEELLNVTAASELQEAAAMVNDCTSQAASDEVPSPITPFATSHVAGDLPVREQQLDAPSSAPSAAPLVAAMALIAKLRTYHQAHESSPSCACGSPCDTCHTSAPTASPVPDVVVHVSNRLQRYYPFADKLHAHDDLARGLAAQQLPSSPSHTPVIDWSQPQHAAKPSRRRAAIGSPASFIPNELVDDPLGYFRTRYTHSDTYPKSVGGFYRHSPPPPQDPRQRSPRVELRAISK